MLKLILNGSNPEFGRFFNATIIPLWCHLSMLPWAGSPKSHAGAFGGISPCADPKAELPASIRVQLIHCPAVPGREEDSQAQPVTPAGRLGGSGAAIQP